jgi:protein arginine kinase activator
MKCDMCENTASVFLTQIVDGKMTQVNLCDKCSKDKGVTDPTGFQLAEFLLGTAAQKKTKAVSTEDDTLACPECGFTRAHLKKIGRMGCPECYRTFQEDLDGMLKAMHKGTRHVGKTPGKPVPAVSTAAARRLEAGAGEPAPSDKPPSAASTKKRLAELKSAIEKAVEEERYEDAAKLRDEMRALEQAAK